MDRYFDKCWPTNKDLFTELARFDGNDVSRYPGFDELYAAVKTKVEKADFRELLRDHLRRRVGHELKREYAADFQADVQLQRAILEMLKQTQGDPASIVEYKPFAAKFDDTKTGMK